ncbi:conserved hypothetical protein [Vibrio chagasii]|nr:conserved hypothetical protein [Vibrio chagasii]
MTPEEVKDSLYDGNFWAETGIEAKFFFVDASYAIILIMSTINLFSLTTMAILVFFFVFFAILNKFQLTISEFGHIALTIVCKKKYRRY